MKHRIALAALPFVSLFAGCASQTNTAWPGDIVPAEVTPALPNIPDTRVSLTDYKPAGDGVGDDSAAFTKAMADLSAQGGGHLVVPAGRYLIGPIQFASRIDLHLDAGATILAYNDTDRYPIAPSKYFKNQPRHPDVISADFCHDISITGEGTIDGQGTPWWKKFKKHKGPGPQPAELYPHRPNLVVLNGCERVLVQGVTLKNSPDFHLIPQQCRDVTIDGLTITAPADSPNTDGIDPSGRRFRITHCDISVGDDNIAIKPQLPPSWPNKIEPGHASCEDFYIADNHFGRGHGMSIGGQTPDGLKRLIVRDCTFDGTNVGIRMKAQQGTGGPVEGCLYENLTMRNCKTAILITSYYPAIPKDPATMPSMRRDATTPVWRDIAIRNVTATGSTEAGGLIGLAERPIENVRFENVSIEAKKPMRVVDARGVHFVNTRITLPNKAPGVVAARSTIDGIDVGQWTGAIEPVKASGAPAGIDDAPDTTRPG